MTALKITAAFPSCASFASAPASRGLFWRGMIRGSPGAWAGVRTLWDPGSPVGVPGLAGAPVRSQRFHPCPFPRLVPCRSLDLTSGAASVCSAPSLPRGFSLGLPSLSKWGLQPILGENPGFSVLHVPFPRAEQGDLVGSLRQGAGFVVKNLHAHHPPLFFPLFL